MWAPQRRHTKRWRRPGCSKARGFARGPGGLGISPARHPKLGTPDCGTLLERALTRDSGEAGMTVKDGVRKRMGTFELGSTDLYLGSATCVAA